MRTTLKYLCLVCVTSLLAACGESDGSTSMKGQVLEKVQSPDGLVAATSTREAGDEDTPASYRVYIEKSRDPAHAVEVMEADRSDAPRLRWLGPGSGSGGGGAGCSASGGWPPSRPSNSPGWFCPSLSDFTPYNRRINWSIRS